MRTSSEAAFAVLLPRLPRGRRGCGVAGALALRRTLENRDRLRGLTPRTVADSGGEPAAAARAAQEPPRDTPAPAQLWWEDGEGKETTEHATPAPVSGDNAAGRRRGRQPLPDRLRQVADVGPLQFRPAPTRRVHGATVSFFVFSAAVTAAAPVPPRELKGLPPAWKGIARCISLRYGTAKGRRGPQWRKLEKIERSRQAAELSLETRRVQHHLELLRRAEAEEWDLALFGPPAADVTRPALADQAAALVADVADEEWAVLAFFRAVDEWPQLLLLRLLLWPPRYVAFTVVDAARRLADGDYYVWKGGQRGRNLPVLLVDFFALTLIWLAFVYALTAALTGGAIPALAAAWEAHAPAALAAAAAARAAGIERARAAAAAASSFVSALSAPLPLSPDAPFPAPAPAPPPVDIVPPAPPVSVAPPVPAPPVAGAAPLPDPPAAWVLQWRATEVRLLPLVLLAAPLAIQEASLLLGTPRLGSILLHTSSYFAAAAGRLPALLLRAASDPLALPAECATILLSAASLAAWPALDAAHRRLSEAVDALLQRYEACRPPARLAVGCQPAERSPDEIAAAALRRARAVLAAFSAWRFAAWGASLAALATRLAARDPAAARAWALPLYPVERRIAAVLGVPLCRRLGLGLLAAYALLVLRAFLLGPRRYSEDAARQAAMEPAIERHREEAGAVYASSASPKTRQRRVPDAEPPPGGGLRRRGFF